MASGRGRIRVVLIDRKADDETTSLPIDVTGLSKIVFYLQGNGTTSGGTITYEESTTNPTTSEGYYGGTWSIIGSANNASDVTGDKQKATHVTVGAYHLVRARISDAITGGGTVTVVLVAFE